MAILGGFPLEIGPSLAIMPLRPIVASCRLISIRNQGELRMPRNWTRIAALAMAGVIVTAVSARAGDPTASLKQGNPQIKSAGPIGFGPDGILFGGDTQGSALFAIDTGDRPAASQKHAVKVDDLAGKVAGMLGTDPKQVMI